MIDPNSEEFKTLFATWLGALKVLDTKLHAYYTALAALENSALFAPAAPYFKEAVLRSQKDADLISEMDRKYDQARQKWEQLSLQSDFLEALASWLQEYRLRTPELE